MKKVNYLLIGGHTHMENKTESTTPSLMSMQPRVLTSTFFVSTNSLKPNTPMNERVCFDYELEFYVDSNEGKMVINGERFEIHKNSIILRKPGEVVQGIAAYNCYLVCFDLFNYRKSIPKDYSFSTTKPIHPLITNGFMESIPHLIHLPDPELYHQLFQSLYHGFIELSPINELKMNTLLTTILLQIYDHSRAIACGKGSILHYKKIQDTIGYIHQNFKSQLTLNDLSRMVHLSPSYFHHIFKESVGMTMNEYIIKVRLDHAKAMLIKEQEVIADIAYDCGFEHPSYFYTLFKKRIGMTPRNYRKLYQRPLNEW